MHPEIFLKTLLIKFINRKPKNEKEIHFNHDFQCKIIFKQFILNSNEERLPNDLNNSSEITLKY